MRVIPSRTAEMATSLGLSLEKPATLADAAIQEKIRNAKADAMIVAAYGQLLPQIILDTPKYGCLNIHASLLPRWRGAAPVQRAIEAGDAQTGISIMQMEAGLDTGPLLLTESLQILADDTGETLLQKLTALGATSIVKALAQLPSLTAIPQPTSGVTYARKLEKSEAQIDWALPAIEIERRLRAFDPFPGEETRLGGQTLKVWRAEALDPAAPPGSNSPGTVVEAGGQTLKIQCGLGVLSLKTVQKAGGRRLTIAEFLRGTAVTEGTILK